MSAAEQTFRAIFTTELLVILVLLVFNTYLLTYRPVVAHLREIYFVNSTRFKRSWYLVIGAITFFVISQAFNWARNQGLIGDQPPVELLFQIIFGLLLILAFWEIVMIFRRYIPHIGADEHTVSKYIAKDLRQSVRNLDTSKGIKLDVTIGKDIYGGRPTLGPSVSLSHYRGAILGITQYLEHRFGELGDTLLYAVGRQTGLAAAHSMQEEGLGGDQLLQEFLQSMLAANMGIPKVLQQTSQRVNIRFDECCVCSGMTPVGMAECHYLSGLFAGLYEALDGAVRDVKEVKCNGKHDSYCEFQIERVAVI